MPFEDYARAIGSFGLASSMEINELAKNGDAKALAEANLRLVIKIANEYAGMGISMNELVSAGNLGLVQAAMRYNPSVGAKFSTYAQFYIRHEIKEAISKLRTIIGISNGIYQRKKRIREIKKTIGDNASVDEIAKKAGTSNKKYVESCLGDISFVSMEEHIDNDGAKTYGDVIGDMADDNEWDSDTLEALKHGLATALTAMEREVIKARFGIDGVNRQTLEELGKEFGRTAERMRQIEEVALKKLKDYLE